MNRFKSGCCPACGGTVHISRISCKDCGAEYPVSEDFPIYSQLPENHAQFLTIFLKCRGSLKAVGEYMGLSYPAVKKRLDDLLETLGYQAEKKEMEKIDMSILDQIDSGDIKASAIIKKKLYESGGDVTIRLLDGKPCRIIAQNNGISFTSDKLDYNLKYDYTVFDYVVELLKRSKGGKAPKGNAHGKEDKVGYGKCTADTVVGTIAIEYFKKKNGESTYDPVFILAAMLDWAGIANNRRGYIELTGEYRELVGAEI